MPATIQTFRPAELHAVATFIGCKTVIPCTRNGSVLWGRVPGFAPWFAVCGRLLTNRELMCAIRLRLGVRVTRRSVEGLRRTYDVPMMLAARRRAYVERDRIKIAPIRPGRVN